MSKKFLWKYRRKLIDSRKPANPGLLSELGSILLNKDYIYEAAEFFQRAGDQEALKKLRETAISEGDLFLLNYTGSVLGVSATPQELNSLAEVAQRKGFNQNVLKIEKLK
ncbi:MAG: hypothetical protein LBF22_01360 [Deltaproteobacteria bacterium]|nr:hypothetical protein [Deltaproteobacteria bacterium]